MVAVTPVWFGPADLAWLEPDTDDERDFINGCPEEWDWDRVKLEWDERGD